MLALTGFLTVVALALLLLYRVYVHHTHAAPYVDGDHPIVQRDVKFASAFS